MKGRDVKKRGVNCKMEPFWLILKKKGEGVSALIKMWFCVEAARVVIISLASRARLPSLPSRMLRGEMKSECMRYVHHVKLVKNLLN